MALKSLPGLNFDPGPIFGRHESFHPRFGWLKKGFDHFEALNKVDAPVELGVGKNMVNAIKYWCVAFKLLEEQRVSRGNTPLLSRSSFGESLFGPRGHDPFMEHPATQWLLHWYLLKTPCYATAWRFAFFTFNRSVFTAEDLVEAITINKRIHYPNAKTTEGTIRKDVACLLRMYSRHGEVGRAVADDTLDSPFADLGLIVANAQLKQYSFNIGPKSSLPPEICVAACLEFIAAEPSASQARTIALGRVLNEEGAPGKAFKLSESSLCEAIERVERNYSGMVSLTETAGIVQLALHRPPENLAAELLNTFFARECMA